MQRLFNLVSFALATTQVAGQFVGDLPGCWQDCIDKQNIDCDVLDIPCICRASKGDFLPKTVVCARETCDGQLDVALVLTPLQLACRLAGQAIPESAIESAQSEASATATPTPNQDPITVEVTVTSIVTPTSEETSQEASQTTTEGPSGGLSLASMLSTLVTRTTTDENGNTIYLVQPVVIGPGTLSYGPASTVTTPITASTTSGESTASETAAETAAETTNGSPHEQHGKIARDAVSFGLLGFVMLRML